MLTQHIDEVYGVDAAETRLRLQVVQDAWGAFPSRRLVVGTGTETGTGTGTGPVLPITPSACAVLPLPTARGLVLRVFLALPDRDERNGPGAEEVACADVPLPLRRDGGTLERPLRVVYQGAGGAVFELHASRDAGARTTALLVCGSHRTHHAPVAPQSPAGGRNHQGLLTGADGPAVEPVRLEWGADDGLLGVTAEVVGDDTPADANHPLDVVDADGVVVDSARAPDFCALSDLAVAPGGSAVLGLFGGTSPLVLRWLPRRVQGV